MFLQVYTAPQYHSTHVTHLRQTVKDDGAALREGGAHPASHSAGPGSVVRLGSKPKGFFLDCRNNRGNDTDTISVFSFGHLSFFLSTSGMLSLCLVAMEQFSRQSCVISMLVNPTTQAMSGVGESGPAQTVITLFTGSLELAATDGYCLTLGCKRVERKTITTGDSKEGCT